jgi:hypothetical protein
MRLTTGLTLLAAVGLSACTTTVVNTNRAANVPTPSIAVYDTVASVDIGEKISGEGCATKFLFLNEKYVGDVTATYLEVHGQPSDNIVDRAKAIASYKALTNGTGLTTDIMVNPVWEITRDGGLFSLFREQACAKVVGYRGVIKSFKTLETTNQFKAKEPAAPSMVRKFFGEF